MSKKKLMIRKGSMSIKLIEETEDHLFVRIAVSDEDFNWHRLKLKIPKDKFTTT
jgi:hypothetical protein